MAIQSRISLPTFIRWHWAATCYALASVISWGSILIALGLDGFVDTKLMPAAPA